MKRITILVFVLATVAVSAQNKSTIETRALINNYNEAKSVERMSSRLLERYPIRETPQGIRIGVLAKVTDDFDADALEREGIKVTSRIGDIVAMRMPIERLGLLQTADGIEVYSVAHRVSADMDKTRGDTRTDSVQAGLGVPAPFDGEGVLIGITDWGFDYTHPNLNTSQKPRILKAWDQFKRSGPAPDGFDYGTVYSGYSELKAAKGDTAGLYGYATHGTHVAGICGGNGYNGHAIGQAPAAQFLLGSWFLDEAAWLDQAAWMWSVAKEEQKRLVINGSWGMYNFSTLDGTSLLSQAINTYADSGVVFVTSGGNNGDCKFHLQHTFDGTDTLISIAQWYGSGIGQSLIYWGEAGAANQFVASFALVSKGNTSNIVYGPLFATSADIPYTEGFVVAGNDTIRYDVMTESSNPLDGRSHVLLNVSKNSGYKLMMMCIGEAGAKVNIWNLANLSNNAGNMGCDFANEGIFGCQNGDTYYGIGEPACADKTMSVAAHVADKIIDTNTHTWETGDLTYFSSYGPTLDGRNKPEISAPGSNVVSSISSWSDQINTYSAVYTQISNYRGYIWSRMSGTSMSGPAVTGIVALMLQANPNLTFDQIREILTSTARNDDKTGALHANDSVSIRWGYGKADALKAVNAAYDRLDIEQAIETQPKLVVFPNPANDYAIVRTGSNQEALMQIYTINGKLINQSKIISEAVVDVSKITPGIYIVRVTDRVGVRTEKLVIGD